MNLAYGLSQGLAAGAGAVSALASNEIKKQSDIEAEKRAMDQKLDLYTRQKAIDEVMAQRAAEYKQQQAAKNGAAIDTEAKGILNTQQGDQVRSLYGDNTLTNDDLAPEELAAFPSSDIDKSTARAAAARKLGMLDHAKEEDANLRNLILDKRADRQDDINNRRVDVAEQKNEILERYQQQREERQSTLETARARADSDKATATDRNASRTATIAAMKDAREQAKQVEMELKTVTGDLTMDEKVKKDLTATLQKQLSNLNGEAANYRKLLGSDGIAGGGDAAPSPTPAPRPAPSVGTEINGLVFAGGDPNDKNAWKPKAAAAPMAYTPPTSSGTHDEPAAAPMKANGKSDIVKRLADIEDMLKDPAMGGKDRLTLEKLDLLRQLNQSGILNSVQSLGR